MAASSAITAADASPRVVEDCCGVLRVLSDGIVVRSAPPVADDVPVDPSVEWKDVVYDAVLGLSLRVYRPAAAAVAGDGEKLKLPFVVVFHGGDFCISAYALPTFHAACTRLAAGTGAVSSPLTTASRPRAPPARRNRRRGRGSPLAPRPRRRRPMDLRARRPGQAPTCVTKLFSGKVFVSGESAGGVLAHDLNVRFTGGAPTETLGPVRLCGFIPLMPFFIGKEPKRSELSCLDDAYLNRNMLVRFLRLCLPPGTDADHPFGPDSPRLEGVVVRPTLVVMARDDILRDINVEYVRQMAEMGKPVEVVEFARQGHTFFSHRPWAEPVDELVRVFKQFMDKQVS
ncbi:hypothetical protein QOZ80_8BG0658970 [Eleusine coracana subsp. coracana]|nr:hypothetical protein QOZ80_8BG0658970 [Eleusine coracana subsp. coracana]